MIVSNNLLGKLRFPKETIVRVNQAWIKTLEEAQKILQESKYDVYLDYPQGRTKPPKPTITLEEAMSLAKYKKVRYFAVSNVEDRDTVIEIRTHLPFGVKFVAKIETERGVNNLWYIYSTGVEYLMLDKEDLYVNVGMDSNRYNELVDKVRDFSKSNKVTLFELQGVIFS